MPTDLDTIKDLEREVGLHLPARPVGGKLPHLTVSHPRGARSETEMFEEEEEERQDLLHFREKVLAAHEADPTSIFSEDEFLFSDFCYSPAFGYFLDSKKNVVGLSLAAFGLSSIPPSLPRLTNLRKLNLGENLLTEFPEELEALQHLRMLQLYMNRISVVPPSALAWRIPLKAQLEAREGIVLEDNPLESPPIEILSRGPSAVRTYFAELALEQVPINEVKVLFVGDGGAGKTCLVKRLLHNTFDENERQTDGINIDGWAVSATGTDVKVNMWDFGGQEIMHATHQFFLSKRSLYVLVLDGRKEEDPEYWLKHIESFGGNSPILVVLNKVDENPGFDVNRRFLQRKYKGIVGFNRVSCRSNTGIGTFKNALIKALSRVEIARTTWPRSWFGVKAKLENMPDPFISYDQYRLLCEEVGIAEYESQDLVVGFLHDLGIVVHFDDFQLRDLHVLEPRWLTEAVYRIINSPLLARAKGVLRLRDFAEILAHKHEHGFSYPPNVHPYIVTLMKKFKLCYSIDDETILIPDLLEVQEPEIDIEYNSAVCLRVDYDFLPKSVIARFIVRKHGDIDGNLRWRTGVVLRNDDFQSRAMVKVDEAAKQVHIWVEGGQRRDYLTVIRAALLEINQRFEKLQYSEKVPLPDNPRLAVSYSHLKRLEDEGIRDVYPDGASHQYNVKDLLGTLYVETKRTEEEFIRILEAVVRSSDSEESALETANNIIIMQPTFLGFGVNLNEMVRQVWKRMWRQ